jgi:hypothetical protein
MMNMTELITEMCIERLSSCELKPLDTNTIEQIKQEQLGLLNENLVGLVCVAVIRKDIDGRTGFVLGGTIAGTPSQILTLGTLAGIKSEAIGNRPTDVDIAVCDVSQVPN